MKNQFRKMLDNDILRCQQAIDNGGEKSVYEELLARYKTLYPDIEKSIPNYVHIPSSTDSYTNELKALKSILETYATCNILPAAIEEADCTNNEDSINEPLIFLSHKSDDKGYADALEKFIIGLGVKDDQLVYSSHPLHKIPLDENIYDYLRKNINRSIFMIILWSNKYLESPACLNEMGAAWVVQCDYTNIYVPTFSFGNPKYHECAVDTRKMGAVLNGDAHCKQNILELKDKIESLFNLKNDQGKITYLLDNFIAEIKEILENGQNEI